MSVKAVFFDLDETLLARRQSLSSFLANQYERLHAIFSALPFQYFHDRFLELDARGQRHKHEVYDAILGEADQDRALINSLFEDYLEHSPRFATPFEGLEECLTRLRKVGLKIGIITNGMTILQRRNIAALGLDRIADAILISEQERLRKPDPAIFRRAAEYISIPVQNCAFVGDNPETDILGAHAVGMATLWFPNGAIWQKHLPPNPGGEIDCLLQIPDQLNLP